MLLNPRRFKCFVRPKLVERFIRSLKKRLKLCDDGTASKHWQLNAKIDDLNAQTDDLSAKIDDSNAQIGNLMLKLMI